MKWFGVESTPQEFLEFLGGLTGLFRRKVPHELELLKVCRKAFTGNQPLTTFCYFSKYREFAVNLSKTSTHFLLWTMEGSPLHSTRGDVPTESDKCFAQIKLTSANSNKIRLVVFQNVNQINGYFEPKGEDKHKKRRFEESALQNNGKLYFSSRTRLKKHFGFLPKGVMDVGFIMSSKDFGQGIAFESGFDASEQCENSNVNRKAKHVTMFRPSVFKGLSKALRENELGDNSYSDIWGNLIY